MRLRRIRSRDTVMRGVGTTYEDLDLDVCVLSSCTQAAFRDL